MNKAQIYLATCLTVISALALGGCSSDAAKSTPTPSASVSQELNDSILKRLQVIADASEAKMTANGLTESYYVNSQGTAPFDDFGELSWTTVYDPVSKQNTTSYPGNPLYREPGVGPQAIGITLSELAQRKTTDPAVTEKDGVFTLPGELGSDFVAIVYTKDGLITAVLIQDDVDAPSFTNYYEINNYNINNPIADEILKIQQ